MRYTTLFLDLDNTLLDFNMAEAVAIEKVLKKHNLPSDDNTIKTYSNINLEFWKRYERGEIPREAIFEGRFKKLLEVLGEERDTSAISKDYFQELSEGYFKIDGAIEILTYLKEKGYYLCATTNGISFTQKKRIKNSGLEPYFDEVFISEDTLYKKPQREYFEFVIKNIPEKNKRNILIIGDSQSSDILGGINSQIDTCWYNPDADKPDFKNRFEIRKLSELKNIL